MCLVYKRQAAHHLLPHQGPHEPGTPPSGSTVELGYSYKCYKQGIAWPPLPDWEFACALPWTSDFDLEEERLRRGYLILSTAFQFYILR
jgi:hypothetical protein